MTQHILLAEDNPELLDLLAELFQCMEYMVSTAHTGDEAIKLIEECRPDIIIVDKNIPHISGLVVLDYLRQQPGGEHIKSILITGDSRIRNCPKASLADKIFIKPFDIDELLYAVNSK